MGWWKKQIDLLESTVLKFGDEKLGVLLGHFYPTTVNLAEATIEWTALKSTLYSSQLDIGTLTWKKLNEMYKESYQNIFAVMDLIMSIPGSSSECERGFRQMKSVKTTFRSSLSEESLSHQMTIKLHSASIEEFDPMPAIQLWNNGCTRRPNFRDNRMGQQLKAAVVEASQEATNLLGEAFVHDQILNDEIENDIHVDNIEPLTPRVSVTVLGGCGDDSDYSDEEEYSTEAGVWRAMCREGLIEE